MNPISSNSPSTLDIAAASQDLVRRSLAGLASQTQSASTPADGAPSADPDGDIRRLNEESELADSPAALVANQAACGLIASQPDTALEGQGMSASASVVSLIDGDN